MNGQEQPGAGQGSSLTVGPPAQAFPAPEQPPGAGVICIFGASGDLTGRKLIPALFNLHLSGDLPSDFRILGLARSEMDDEAFRRRMAQALGLDQTSRPQWTDFAARLHYQPLGYDDPASYQALVLRLEEMERLTGEQGGNRLFNLAIPPSLYATVAGNLGRAGLGHEVNPGRRWTRVVVEKPFGRDLASARELNGILAEGFAESQVFRIDHYMAKETVQDIIIFRFANAVFEPIWNRNYVDYVSIVAAETLGVEHRAGYYEQAGVLRDMFQNHMMQLMALAAAEPPSRFQADRVRDEKVKLFRSLRPMPLEDLYEHLVLGQYEAGTVGETPVPAYRADKGVDPQSLTPTYGCMRVFVDNWRWQGVPFYLTSGKRLGAKVTRLDIQFKEVPHSLFRQVLGSSIRANRLSLAIEPQEAITLTFQVKQPGGEIVLRTVAMGFDYQSGGRGPALSAYEKALADVLRGDQTLFWRQDGLELCWAFLEPILQECESCRERSGHLHRYPAGSWGPEKARDLLPPGTLTG